MDMLVPGGGVAGLSASLAFARSGHHVVLLERDGPPNGDAPDEVFDRWDRPGIAHFRQPHNFLGLARDVLLEEAPDVLDAVVAAGGLENRQYELIPGGWEPEDERLVSICARRAVFEIALRRAVEAEPNVSMRVGTRVVGLLTAGTSRSDLPHVVGVRTGGGEEVRADLVADALGRTSPVMSWLDPLTVRPPLERRSECGLLYYSRHFRCRPGLDVPAFPALLRGPRGDLGYLAFAVFVEDNRTFALVMMIPPWERELRALRFEEAYMAAASSMPSLAPWVHPDQSEPITPVLPMGRLQNLHRSLMVDHQPVVVGIQPIGDALCHTNPSVAYGASLSVHHGFVLSRVAARAEDIGSIAAAFDDAVGEDVAARFDAVSAEDRDRLRLWGGEPIDLRNPDDSMALFLRMSVYPAAARDPQLFRAVARRVNLFDPPDAMQRDPELIERARRMAVDAGPPPRTGPTRAELLETISAARN
ncbi:MAG TPA: hypothetical protein DIT48_01750 [Actinobacteria bacterium]|nr:hypothetical protein [Actinomycetota bacterium]